jgi:hypothetical protein
MATTENGFYKLTMYLRPDQYLQLHAIALQAMVERGGGRPDVSKIIREMIDHYAPAMQKALKPQRRKAA